MSASGVQFSEGKLPDESVADLEVAGDDEEADPTIAKSSRRLLSNRREQRGILLTLLGVVVVSFDAAILRLAARHKPQLVTLLFWRLLFVGALANVASGRVERVRAGWFRAAPKLATAIVVTRSPPDVLLAVRCPKATPTFA